MPARLADLLAPDPPKPRPAGRSAAGDAPAPFPPLPPEAPLPPLEPDPVPLLRDIQERCRVLSDERRRSLPADVAARGLLGAAATLREMLDERAVLICFLLDQHASLRFNALRRLLGRISTRTLAEKLSGLQARGLVTRQLFDESPPRTEYRLTPRGRALADLMFPILLLATAEGPEWPASPDSRALAGAPTA